jgi:hypothetical protein
MILYGLANAKWLRERGAAWPTSFVAHSGLWQLPNATRCWTVPAMQWALANGYTWAATNWQCQQLAPQLHIYAGSKVRAQQMFAWAHNNGCPCTCNDQL